MINLIICVVSGWIVGCLSGIVIAAYIRSSNKKKLEERRKRNRNQEATFHQWKKINMRY